jgi:hypothetical protein
MPTKQLHNLLHPELGGRRKSSVQNCVELGAFTAGMKYIHAAVCTT